MYCRSYGQQISDDAYVCPMCGVKTKDEPDKNPNDHSVVLGLIALIVGIIIPLVAWICGGIGLSHASKNNNQAGKTLCIIGIIVGTIMFFVYLGQTL